MTLGERFWSKADRSGGPDACWPWTAHKTPSGQGTFRVGSRTDGSRRTVNAYTVAYELAHGSIPERHHVHHRCENKSCVNPRHLVALKPGEHRDTHLGQLSISEVAA